MIVSLAMIGGAGELIEDYDRDVPPEWKTVHELLSDMAPDMQLMADSYFKGVTEKDADSMAAGNQLKDTLNVRAALLIEELDRMSGD